MHFVWERGPVFLPFWNFIPLLFFLYYLSLKLLYALRGSLSNYPPYSLTILTYFQTFVSLCHVSGELPGIYVSVIFMTISGLAYIQSTSFLSLFFLTSGQGLHFVFPRFQMNSFPYLSFLKVPFYFFFTIKKKSYFSHLKKKLAHSTWDLSSLTRGGTHTPCTGRIASWSLDCQGSPCFLILIYFILFIHFLI